MAHQIDSIDIRGFRKTHLRQLAFYIRHFSGSDGYYYGNKEEWDKRHADLFDLANRLTAMADDGDLRIAAKPKAKP